MKPECREARHCWLLCAALGLRCFDQHFWSTIAQTVLGFGCWGIPQAGFDFSSQKYQITSSLGTFHCRLKGQCQVSRSHLYHIGRSLKLRISKGIFKNPALPKDNYMMTVHPGRQVHIMTGTGGIALRRGWLDSNRFQTIFLLLKPSVVYFNHPYQAASVLAWLTREHGSPVLISTSVSRADDWFFFTKTAEVDPLLRKLWSEARNKLLSLPLDLCIHEFYFGTSLAPQCIEVNS